MKKILILTGLILALFSCTEETTEIIDVIEAIEVDDVLVKVETLEKEGRVTDLFPDDADMNYLQSDTFAFYINNMLEIKQDVENKQIVIRNLAPLNLENVSLTARFSDIDEEIEIIKLDTIKGHTLTTLDYPFDKDVSIFATKDGKKIDLSGLKGENPTMLLDYAPGEDSLLNKLHNIKSTWKLKFHDFDEFDSETNNWEENMVPLDLRRFTGVMINMVYLLESPEFREAILAEYLNNNNQVALSEDEKEGLLQDLCDIPYFRCGKVVNVLGLGGGSIFGLAEPVLSKYLTSVSHIGDFPIHEVAHMLGYNHSSNLTYPRNSPNGVKSGFTLVGKRIADKFIKENRFPISSDNYYKKSDLKE